MLSIIATIDLPWGGQIAITSYGLALYLATAFSFFYMLRIQSRFFRKNVLANQLIFCYALFFVSSYLSWLFLFGPYSNFIQNQPEFGFHYLTGFVVVFIYLSSFPKIFNNLPFLLDTLAWSVLPGLVLLHTGAFLSGSNFGAPTLTPFGIALGDNPIGVSMTGLVHPVQLYQAANAAILLLILYQSRRFSHKPGFKFIIFFLFYFIFSFITEFFRGDIIKNFYGLSLGQLTLVVMVLLFVPLSLFIWLKLKDSYLAHVESIANPPFPRVRMRDVIRLRVDSMSDLFLNFKLALFVFLFIPLLAVPGNYWTTSAFEVDRAFSMPDDSDRIFINIPSFTLSFRDREYRISPGRVSLQTPVGNGIIVAKRKKYEIRVYRRVAQGRGRSNTGHTVDGKVIKIPYHRMRGLAMKINKLTDYVIHATTEDWSIGTAASHGCIRMRIPDMLKLYPLVKKNTPVVIDYILVELRGNRLYLYKDVYKLRSSVIDGKYVNTFKLRLRPRAPTHGSRTVLRQVPEDPKKGKVRRKRADGDTVGVDAD